MKATQYLEYLDKQGDCMKPWGIINGSGYDSMSDFAESMFGKCLVTYRTGYVFNPDRKFIYVYSDKVDFIQISEEIESGLLPDSDFICETEQSYIYVWQVTND